MTASSASASALRRIIERLETIDAEMALQRERRKDVVTEAKATGFDVKAINEVIRVRKMDRAARAELEEMAQIYAQMMEDGDDRI